MSASDKAYKNARRLRRELSLPEKLLWVRLRGADMRFRRQHPIGPYVLDFYCAAAKLAIEVDGTAHDFGNRPRRDEVRTEWLKHQGMEVLRIPAAEVLADPDAVADKINQVITEELSVEDRLNEEVRQILIDHQDEMRRTSVSYQEMYKKVKQQLARDRKLILR